jgi:hypothetical protein
MFGFLLKLPSGANRSGMVEALYDAGCRLPETPEQFEARCERVAMRILGKTVDPAPGVDWTCNRNWSVCQVRDSVRVALEAEQ